MELVQSKREKLVISCSSRFQEEIQKWKEYFENLGYEVINYPKKINPNNVDEYKKVYINFFKSLDETDKLFILNEKKDGIEGYIGAQTFAELSYVLVQNVIKNKEKKIWILNEPSQDVKCYDEIKRFIELGWIEIWRKK